MASIRSQKKPAKRGQHSHRNGKRNKAARPSAGSTRKQMSHTSALY